MSDLEPVFRNATHAEFLTAVEWAAAEGWNPGLQDAEIFWATDSEGFVCIELEGEVVGTGSIVSYGDFGFMGFFIVRPDLRGKGLGAKFWHWRKARLLERLKPDAAIGMDGVFDMQPFYAKGGFVFSHRNLRMAGVAEKRESELLLTPLSEISFEWIEVMDRDCFGFSRSEFLTRWIQPESGHAYGVVEGVRLKGFGVIRQCREGYKIGPLFADSPEVAEGIFIGLSNEVVGEPIFLDAPENNPKAMRLAAHFALSEVFGCARMYLGPAPELPWERIYGVTSFELG